MKTKPNTLAGSEVVQGQRFDGDDSWWIVEEGCEDVGPFATREDAEAWKREFIGPDGWIVVDG